MKAQKLSRRELFAAALQVSVAGAAGLVVHQQAAAADDTLCADPERLDSGGNNLRTALGYTERSSDPARTCADCGLFKADAANAACGHCMIFSGPANAQGTCESWSARG